MKSLKRGERRHRTAMKALRRIMSDRVEHATPPHDWTPEIAMYYDSLTRAQRWNVGYWDPANRAYGHVCKCFYDQILLGKAKSHTIQRSHFNGVKASLRHYWGGIRVEERNALYWEEEPEPTRTRHSVQWALD